MKVVFMGTTKFSEMILYHLMKHGVNVCLILTIPEEFHISYSTEKVRNFNYADLGEIANQHNIPCFEVDSLPGKKINDYANIIADFEPDVILTLGWYFMVPKSIFQLAPFGAWGIHASLLPKYAGGAPLVWAMINGEKETGVTLFRFDEGVDDGDIIQQAVFPILFEDTIQDVYEKAIEKSKDILLEPLLHPEKIVFKPQKKTLIQVFPQRNPEDGRIDLNQSSLEIYNFIRSQTKPYPGAFSEVAGQKITIWQVRLCENSIKDNLDQNIGEIIKSNEKGYLCLRDGCIELIEVSFSGREGNFPNIAEDFKLWGLILGA